MLVLGNIALSALFRPDSDPHEGCMQKSWNAVEQVPKVRREILKHIILGIVAAAAFTSSASAQTAKSGSHNPAVKDSSVGKVVAPANGRNSFTRAQATGRIAKAGYTGVSNLVKDTNGVWRGAAMRDGKRVQVGLDYKGNVTTR
jgi:hypothetical protein